MITMVDSQLRRAGTTILQALMRGASYDAACIPRIKVDIRSSLGEYQSGMAITETMLCEYIGALASHVIGKRIDLDESILHGFRGYAFVGDQALDTPDYIRGCVGGFELKMKSLRDREVLLRIPTGKKKTYCAALIVLYHEHGICGALAGYYLPYNALCALPKSRGFARFRKGALSSFVVALETINKEELGQ